MNTKILKLIESLNDSFQGNPWYGESIMSLLKKIEVKSVNVTLPNSNNSIAILVQHLINWRIFVIEKLNGNEVFDIVINSEKDWKKITIKTKVEWDALLNELFSTQNQIIDILKNQDEDAFLENSTLGKAYSLGYLIEGIIQHDIYHLGQIGLLNASINK